MNLELLKKSRIKTKAGDIFVFKPKGKDYYFGRTINTNTNIGNLEDVVLIYLYNILSPDKNIIPELDMSKLLLPPIGTNYRPWIRGYFETVAFKELTQEDVLHPNCFHDHQNIYRDEYGNILDHAYEPVGIWGLNGLLGIDIQISDKLGIPIDPKIYNDPANRRF